MTKQEIAQLLTIIKAVHSNFVSDATKINVWHALIGDISFVDAKKSLYYVLNTCKFEPKPADIREVIFKANSLNIPSAEEAWAEVIKKADFYKAVEWSHPYIEQAVKSVGVRAICASECIGVERAHFIKFYESIVARNNQRQTFQAVGISNIIGQVSSNLALDKK